MSPLAPRIGRVVVSEDDLRAIIERAAHGAILCRRWGASHWWSGIGEDLRLLIQVARQVIDDRKNGADPAALAREIADAHRDLVAIRRRHQQLVQALRSLATQPNKNLRRALQQLLEPEEDERDATTVSDPT